METGGEGRRISSVGLETLLSEAVRGLSTLDAAALESLAESLAESRAGSGERVGLPASAAEWRRAAAQRWVLAHLLGGTAWRLAMLRRIAAPAEGFGGYGGEGGLAAGPVAKSN